MGWVRIFFFLIIFTVITVSSSSWAAEQTSSQSIRIATFHIELTRDGPGIALRDIRRAHPQIKALRSIIHTVNPDILLITGIAYDHEQKTIADFADFVGNYPYYFSLRPSSGYPSGYDLNMNGKSTDRQDALSYGRFPGHQGMAILSKHRIGNAWQDYSTMSFTKLFHISTMKQKDFHDKYSEQSPLVFQNIKTPIKDLPFSSSGHWVVPINISATRTVHLLTFSATAPLISRNSDMTALNLLRNHSELFFWMLFLDNAFGIVPKDFILLGNANTDPYQGNGARALIGRLITHPALQDPIGNTPTVYWAAKTKLAPMRVDYILPSRTLVIRASGIHNPASPAEEKASQHRLIWVDIE